MALFDQAEGAVILATVGGQGSGKCRRVRVSGFFVTVVLHLTGDPSQVNGRRRA